jgi:nascent polypeptide-associated complex subunit beta
VDRYLVLPCDYSCYLGPDNLDNLRRLAEQFQKQAPGPSGGEAAAQDDDDDVPELVAGETFEEAAEEKKESS